MSMASFTLTEGIRRTALAMRSCSWDSGCCQRLANAWGSASKSMRRRTISARRSGSRMWSISMASPKRSMNCGRRSPSSGFIVPIRIKRAGWLKDTPSRSMKLRPIAAESSRTSTTWSLSRLTSSMYRMPRWADASKPGSKRRLPSRIAASMSSAPTTASSVALTGSSTRRAWRRAARGERPAQKWHAGNGAPGGQE